MAGERFYFRDGSSIESLHELREKLRNMSINEFKTHVSEDKNDFAEWIEHSLERQELAVRIRMLLLKEDIEYALDEELGNIQHHDEIKEEIEEEEPKPIILKEEEHTEEKQMVRELPHTIMHKHHPAHPKSSAPDEFIIKEFILGALFGLLLGVIIMAVLYQMGLIGYY